MMTNGEKLKEIFPYLESDKRDLVKVLNIDNLKNWWNSEYQEPTNENDLGVEKIIDEMEKEFEKVDIPIMDKLTLFAKVQNALYKCAVSNSEIPNNSITKNDLGVDCVSRKRVREWLENATDDSIEHAINSNLEFIPSVTPQEPRWIPVSERLPDTDDEVLCWYEYYHWSQEKVLPEYGIGCYFKETSTWYGEVAVGRDARVIAWMPLQPYSEVEE